MIRYLLTRALLLALANLSFPPTIAYAGSLVDANVYFGGFIGLGADRNEFTDSQGFVGYGEDYEIDFGSETPQFGVLIGVDQRYEWARIGMELDAAWLRNSSSEIADPKNLDETVYSSYDALVSLRARLTVPVYERLHLFGTAGLAVGWIENRFVDEDFYCPDTCNVVEDYKLRFDPDDSFADSSTRLGWVVGAGVEWQASDMWSARFDVSYVDFGSDRNYVNTAGFISSSTQEFVGAQPYDIDNKLVIARVAVIRNF